MRRPALNATLRIHPCGAIKCLYTEAIDLRTLGALEVSRATEITFDEEEQCWEVRSALFGGCLFANPSREECLRWERVNLQPS